ncbi:MAG: peptidoglycan bridge formation glycyltransferase FemA/FemB family protein, partial [Candidatus Pacebacteria bacterium]|nr:peptidoglycan bridge formation glycyltransferase FemA/FemB family protein [Candidatus Paceibacterota bacterium]
MRIIQFEDNQKESWNKFIAENFSESFLQSWEWGEFQKSIGRKIWRLAVVEDAIRQAQDDNKSQINSQPKAGQSRAEKFNILAVALIIKHDLPFGKSYLYCPRGPVTRISSIQYPVSSIYDLLFGEIQKIAKKEKSLFLKIDPPISRWFHSGNGPVEPKYKSCAKGPTVLTGLWSQHNYNLKKSLNEIQPKDTLILNLTKSEDNLLKEMKQKTRYNIRLAEKRRVKIKNYELRIDNKKIFKKKFDFFWNLIEETSKRNKIISHSKDYYWKILKNISQANKKQKTKNNNSKNINNQISRNNDNIFRQDQNDNCDCSQKLKARLYLAEYDGKTIVANIILYFGNMAIYLHGASSNEHRNLMAPYLLQWQQIIDAK